MCKPIKEMKIGEGKKIVYSPFSSCVSINFILAKGLIVGAHFVSDRADEIPSLLEDIKNRIGDQQITGAYFIGALEYWKKQNNILSSIHEKFGCWIDKIKTSGESEVITVKIKDDSNITVTVQYPEKAKKKKAEGSETYSRIVKDPYDSD